MIKYYTRLTQQPSESLLGEALKESKNLSDQGHNSWYSNLNSMCLHLFETGIENLHFRQKRNLLSQIKGYYYDHWRCIVNHGKLDFYGTLKSAIVFEEYLDLVKNPNHRRALTKLRISANNLAIETGRFGANRVPREQRICQQCTNGDVEDELHFLLQCQLYIPERSFMLSECIAECSNLSLLNNNDLIVYLLNAGGKIVKLVAKYCYDSFNKRS